MEQPETQVDSSEQEPVQTDNSQPEVKEQETDSFFDPKSVPEELLPAYKQMQSAFTKKTQEIAEVKKAEAEYRAKAEAYDKYQRYIPLLEEMMAKPAQSQESAEMQQLTQRLKEAGYGDDAIEMMKMGADFILNQVQQTNAAKEETAFVTNGIAEAAKLDPRLNDQTLTYEVDGETFTFGKMVEDIVATDPNWTKNPVAATQKAIKKVDALIGKAKTEGKQELSARAKTQAVKFPSVNSSPQGAVDSDQPMTIQEAARQAKAELGLS